ncbi:MAG TPA: hypothetical protein VEY92_00100 [Pseudoxanthomonas sp.]|nr:hypothetical protein [Pseudoxanthomonas sp.]
MHTLHLPRALIIATLLLPCGRAAAESVFTVIPPGVNAATGAANVDVRVIVPTLILLRVGSSNASGGTSVIDTLNFNLAGFIPGLGNLSPSNNNPIAWNGAPPGFAAPQQTVNVSFYSNAATNRINCSIGAWTPAGGPALSAITVAVTNIMGNMPHPGTNLGACAQTTLPRLVNSATWRFTLGGSPNILASGTYSTVITYTASTL